MKFDLLAAAIATLNTLVISALFCLSIFGFSQSALSEDCPRFFKDRELRGASFSVCLTDSDTVPASFNDQISSLNIPKGHKGTLYTDAGFKGRQIEFIGLDHAYDHHRQYECTYEHDW